MRINRAAIKQNAKNIISSSKPSPVLVGLVFLAIVAILQALSFSVSGQYAAYMRNMEQLMAGNVQTMDQLMERARVYVPAVPQPGVFGNMLDIAISLMTLMISTGFTIYCMNVCQFRKADFGNLFDGFAIFFKVLWLTILMAIFVWLWALLFIIPGIIAAYRYRMALYIMLDNPKLGALDCIRASKQMMDGRKGELFVLDLSFLGWALLTLVPFVTIWVTPYTAVTYTNYYLALRNMPRPNNNQTF